jgi:polyribonucleotide nucleotidyltransferase
MTPNPITQIITLRDGRTIEIETGKLAKQADGAVVVKMGGTMLLATIVSSKEAKEGVDFLPLTVEYREKFSAAGRVPGGFLKREGRPHDREILTARLVDRVLRPIFPSDYHAETQIYISLISYDPNYAADCLAGLAASAALAVSDIPFNGPISEVRVARINGEMVVNPSPAEMESADIEMMIGGTADSVVMVEGEMLEVSEHDMLEAIRVAHEAIKDQCKAQIELASKVEKSKTKREYSHETHDEELRADVSAACYAKVYEIAKSGKGKNERSEGFKAVFEEYMSKYSDEEKAEKTAMARVYFHDVEYNAMRAMILDDGIRLDGRDTKTIRPIWSEVDYLPGTHGSSIFTRGETQALASVTLGTSLDANRIDSPTMVGEEKFYLHYNFPPFSTGEARAIRSVSRREIGHGNLAQRALKNMIPVTPYAIRLVSEILESNGSSSMATVCSGTLALMDAGIQLKRPVSGIAMGLITNPENGKFAVLSDILGDEDHLGDMDFKVTGTTEGITACQMDIKIGGLTMEIMEKALLQARDGRLHILGEMMKTLDTARATVKPNAPKMVVIRIPKEFIGAVIGPGGKVIQGLQAETGTTIVLEEVGDQGVVEISGRDAAMMQIAEDRIRQIAFIPIVGEIYNGLVRSIQTYGAFVEIGKGTDGLLHVSEIAHHRVQNTSDELQEGQRIEVKLIAIDERGKLKLSRKALLPKPEENKEPAQ